MVIGANAIVADMAQSHFDIRHAGRHFFGGLAAHMGAAGDFMLACATVGSLWAILWFLDRQRTIVHF